MEAVGLTVGIVGLLPVILQAIQTYQDIRKGVKTARKCQKEIEDIDLALDVQKNLFRNECLALLCQSGLDRPASQAMMRDLSHGSWSDTALENRLLIHLDESYETCQHIIQYIYNIQEEIQSTLQVFDLVRHEKVKGESIKTTFRRLRKTVNFAFDKSTLELKIDKLGQWNRNLKSLRKSRSELSHIQRSTSCTSRCSSRQSLPSHFSEIQKVSNEAYRALAMSFTCLDSSHEQHSAALCLDTEVVEGIRLNMAITYISQSFRNLKSDSIKPEPPIKFLLESKINAAMTDLLIDKVMKTKLPKRPLQLQNNLFNDDCARDVMSVSTDHSTAFSIAPRPGSSKPDGRLKRKVVPSGHSNEFIPKKRSPKSLVESHEFPGQSISGPSVNLGAIESACEYLRNQCGCRGKVKDYSSIAFLHEPQRSNYMFYISTNFEPPEELHHERSFNGISMLEFLGIQSKDSLSIVQQFKFALKLTLGVLQYHSTPWLREEWKLSQLLLLDTPENSPDHFSIYLNSTLPRPKLTNKVSTPHGQAKMETQARMLTMTERQGINNTTLFYLGVALLEIAHWKPLNALREDYDRDNVDTARRLGFGSTKLGTCYDEIVRKCLQCNFGYGTDLGQSALQSAVYSDVVCPLESLIEDLTTLRI